MNLNQNENNEQMNIEHKAKEQISTIFEHLKNFNKSVREHVTADYRRQYFFKRILSMFVFYSVVGIIISMGFAYEDNGLKYMFLIIYTIVAGYFWNYAYFSYQNGVVDTFSRNFLHIGSIFSVIWRVIVHNCLILVWIMLISPFSGVKTWLKAKKHNKSLYVKTQRDAVWD